jgi:hypothetical protein
MCRRAPATFTAAPYTSGQFIRDFFAFVTLTNFVQGRTDDGRARIMAGTAAVINKRLPCRIDVQWRSQTCDGPSYG